MMRIYISFLLVTLLLSGCTQTSESAHIAQFYAIDTSESSKEFHEFMGPMMSQDLLAIPANATVYVFRFDSDPAEIYSGKAPATLEIASKLLRDAITHESNTSGTNLYKLFVTMDKTAQRIGKPFRLNIFTDCGIEEMSQVEIKGAREIVQSWNNSNNFQGIRLIGVRDGWREEIREIVELTDDKLVFQEIE